MVMAKPDGARKILVMEEIHHDSSDVEMSYLKRYTYNLNYIYPTSANYFNKNPSYNICYTDTHDTRCKQ